MEIVCNWKYITIPLVICYIIHDFVFYLNLDY